MAETSLPRTQSGRIQEPLDRPTPQQGVQMSSIPQQPPVQAQSQGMNVASIPESLRTPAMIDMLATQQLQEKARQQNKLLSQVDTLTKALSNGTVSEQEQANLTPQQLRSLQVSDMQSIARHIGMVKFTMSSRGQALDRAIGTLMTGMQNMRAEQRQMKLDARQTIQDTLATVGPDAFMNLGDEEKRKLEKEAGLSTGYIDQARERIEEQERIQMEELERQRAKEDQQMELQRKQFDLQQQKFAFSKMESSRNYALRLREANKPTQIDFGKGYKMERVKETQDDGTEREGLRFVSPTGAPVAAYEYFYATNQQNESLAVGDMIATLKSSHNDDKNIAKLIEEEIGARGEISDDFENTYWWLFRR